MYQLNPSSPQHQARYARTTAYRHAKNVAEFIILMSLSTGATFLARILPPLWIAVLITKLVVTLYLLALAKEESHRLSSLLRGAALLIGFLGGIWDIAYLYLIFDSELLTRWASLGVAGLVVVVALAYSVFKTKFKQRW